MARPKRYATEAEKQAAYRERKKLGLVGKEVVEPNADNLGMDVVKSVAEVVIPVPVVHASDMMKCPKGVDEREWKYALERAARAKRYAVAMPEHVGPSDLKFQDPLWQWENEVKGRFSGIVGGNLKQ